jgi:hypothetical protein
MKGKVEEKQEVIMGVANVEAFFHRNAMQLMDLKRDFGLPMKKREGLQSIDPAEWRSWATEYGIDPDRPELMKIATLEDHWNRKRLAELPDIKLVGLAAIKDYLHRENDEIIRWHHDYDSFPVQVPTEGPDRWHRATASTRELRTWLYENNFQWIPASYVPPLKKEWHRND